MKTSSVESSRVDTLTLAKLREALRGGMQASTVKNYMEFSTLLTRGPLSVCHLVDDYSVTKGAHDGETFMMCSL